jgi:nuclear pore complex protein Nup85
LLETLSRHPSEHLQSVAQHLAPLLSSHPRIVQFTTERDFVVALRRWKEKVKTLRLELDRVPEDAREDEFENWWKSFSNIVGILEGRPEVIQSICLDLNADWKEVCAVWSIFVNHRLRRQDLPCVFPI